MLEFQLSAGQFYEMQKKTNIKARKRTSLMVYGVNFTSLFITVRDRDRPGAQCAPVTQPLRPLGAEMCLQL